jgi:hypothetical protein
MKPGDLVRIKLPSAKGLYVVIERSHNIESESLSGDRAWLLYGDWYGKTRVMEMLEKWMEIVNES